jgi:hypothetical protein
MQLEDEKIIDNRKLRRLEDQKLGGPENCQPSYLLTFSPSYFSKYLRLFMLIRGFPL